MTCCQNFYIADASALTEFGGASPLQVEWDGSQWFYFSPMTGGWTLSSAAQSAEITAADRSTWTTQPCGTGLQIEAIGECAVITDGDASVDGFAEGTPVEADYYKMPLTAKSELLRTWAESLAGTSTKPGGGDETALTIPEGVTLVPYTTSAGGVDTTGVIDNTATADGDGQLVFLDKIYIYGKEGQKYNISVEKTLYTQLDAVAYSGGFHDNGVTTSPETFTISPTIEQDRKGVLEFFIFDATGGFQTPFISDSGGTLISTTEQNTLVVDVYRINGELYGKLPTAFNYQGAGELPAGTYVPLQDGQATWCCGCETDALAEANAHLAEIEATSAQSAANTAPSALSTGSDAQIINALPSTPTLPAGTKLLFVGNNSTSPITVTTSIGDMIVDPGTTGRRSVDEWEPDLTITNIVDAGTAYSGENITINVVTRS